jgi:hypoxanthine phosphoribosyltransferase
MNKEVIVDGRSFELYINKEEIQKINRDLGERLNQYYKGKSPIIISVLDGAFMFTADLMRYFDFDHELSFVKLKSYSDTKSTGEVKEMLPLQVDVSNRDVLIVEDIVDTGTTLFEFVNKLKLSNPLSVKVCTLLYKPLAIKFPLVLDFVGKEIPNDFVIGYGMDVNGLGRNFSDLYKIKES